MPAVHQGTTCCGGLVLATTVVEIITASVDLAAVVLIAISFVSPWMVSGPCSVNGCPQGSLKWMQSQSWTDDSPYMGLAAAGGVNKWHAVNLTYFFPNRSDLAATYQGWTFPAGYIGWNEVGALGACNSGSPVAVFWAVPYGFCSGPIFNVPTNELWGTMTLLVVAAVFAFISGLTMIAARKGRNGLALCSTCASSVSAGACIGAIAIFSTWSYVRSQQGVTVGTIPLRAISPDGMSSQLFPVGVSMTWGAGWGMIIAAIVLEGITTIVSCIAGTSSGFWAKEESETDWHKDPPYWINPDVLDKMQDHHHKPSLTQLEEARQAEGDRALAMA